jgi:hypothetical protein
VSTRIAHRAVADVALPLRVPPFLPKLLGLGVVLLALYLATLQRVHSWDDMAYTARSVHDPLISEAGPASGLFHPHHLLYVPLVILWRGLLRPFGIGGGDPFLPLQILNALLGAGVAVLVGLIAAGRSGRSGAALAAAAGCGLSNGIWVYSTQGEVMIPALFFFLLGAWLLSGGPGRAAPVAAATSLAASVLLHQFTVLLVTPLLLVWLRARPRRNSALLCAGVVGLVVAPYVAVAMAAEHIRSPLVFLDWVLAMRHRSTFGHLSPMRALGSASRAFLESFLSLSPLRDWFTKRSPSTGLPAAVDAALLIALPAVAMQSLRAVARALFEREAVTLALGGGMVFAMGFNLWFQPGVDDFWTYLPALVWIVAATHSASGSRGRLGLTVLLLALGAANLAWRALPDRDPRHAPYVDQIDYARRHLARGDVLILGDNGALLHENLLALPLLEGVEIVLAPVDSTSAEAHRFRTLLLPALARQRRSGGKLVTPEDVLPAVSPLVPSLQWIPADTLRGHRMFATSVPAG